MLEREVGAVHIHDVLPVAVGLLPEDLDEFALVCDAGDALGLRYCGESKAAPIVGEIPPPLDGVGGNLELYRIGVEKSAPERLDRIVALLRRQIGRQKSGIAGIRGENAIDIACIGSSREGGIDGADLGLVSRRRWRSGRRNQSPRLWGGTRSTLRTTSIPSNTARGSLAIEPLRMK